MLDCGEVDLRRDEEAFETLTRTGLCIPDII